MAAKLSALTDRNSLFGDIGSQLIEESIEDAVRKSTAGPGAAAAAEILKDVLRRPWVRRALRVVPDGSYKVIAMALSGVIQNKIDAVDGLDSETKLVLKHAVNPLILGLGKGMSDAAAAGRRFGAADVDRVVDEAVSSVRTGDLDGTPSSERSGRIDLVAHSPIIDGVHLVKLNKDGTVARYADGSPVLLCRRLRRAKYEWDQDHQATTRRVGRGRDARMETIPSQPFPLFIDSLEDAVLMVDEPHCSTCMGARKMREKVEASGKSLFDILTDEELSKIIAIHTTGVLLDEYGLAEIEASGLMDEFKNLHPAVAKALLRSLDVDEDGLIPEDQFETAMSVIRGHGEGQMTLGEQAAHAGLRLWRMVSDQDVETPAWAISLGRQIQTWTTRGAVAYLSLAATIVIYAFALLGPTSPGLGFLSLLFSFLCCLIFLGLFRPLQELVNSVLRRVPMLGANPGDWLVKTGKEILGWLAFAAFVGSLLHFFGLHYGYRWIMFSLLLPGVLSYSVLEKMSNEPQYSWTARRWNLQLATVLRRVIMAGSALLYGHAGWTVLGKYLPETQQWLYAAGTGAVGVLENWSGLAGMALVTVVVAPAILGVGSSLLKNGAARVVFIASVTALLALLWVVFGISSLATWLEPDESSSVTTTQFQPASSPVKVAPRSAKASSGKSKMDRAEQAFRELCRDSSTRGRKALGCPGN